ncbi:MAG: SRPBCC domain-containing protein [Candidatus Diapherotrites archaeon]|nr:SRPBCC domain-containing protein [Candidatus Diapherotrites archaeon]
MDGGKQMKDELVITRVFNAPVELVWRAWSEPEMAKKWWGPKEFSAPAIKMDFRVGGKYLFCMRGPMPDGKEVDIYSTGTYKEIIPLKKIVATDSFADEKGNVVTSDHYGMPGIPKEMEVAITFEDMGGKTKMVLMHKGMPGFMSKDANAGWSTSFDKLENALKEM